MMDRQILAFLQAMDRELARLAAEGERLDLYLLGRSALVLHYHLPASTRDIDVVQMRSGPLEERAVELFGEGSRNAQELGLFLEAVPQGLPPVPQHFRSRCTEVAGEWRVLRLWRLEPNDLAATKLKCFRPQDREDLRFLCDEGLVARDALRRSLESAFLWSAEKDDDEDRERAFANLDKVIAYLEGQARSL